ncbi:MAG TPA: DinB family protein [Streptosporangiaceae bacterium]
MIDDLAKEHLHDHLRWVREDLVWKLDGLGEYDIRRPLTSTGTNLLGLVKHCAVSGSRYFGEVFGRPFPEPLPRWDDEAASGIEFWATEHETREDIVGLYRRVWEHSDATIEALGIDAPGYVPWWQEKVMLFNIMAHVLSDTTRHAGHADILREQLDGSVGMSPGSAPLGGHDSAFWAARCATIEQAAAASH